MKLNIYLFRHGKTIYNTKGIFTGFIDSKLTKEGIRNANVVARKLKNKKIDVAFQTKLSRSKDTLKPVLKFHPECKEIITANRMIERNYGIYSGMSHDIFIKKYGQKKYDEIHRGWDVRIPKGENFKQVEDRVKVFIKNLIKFMKKEKVNVAISAHGNSIRLFRKIWEKASIKKTVKWFIPYDKVYNYKIEA
jgi:2,3-bisphosphoglycerate-dependent phosphoglycerate mutase